MRSFICFLFTIVIYSCGTKKVKTSAQKNENEIACKVCFIKDSIERIENEIHALKAINSYKSLSDDEKNKFKNKITYLQNSLENLEYDKELSDSILFRKCLKTIKKLKNIELSENIGKVNKIKAYSIVVPYCGVELSFYKKDSIYESMDARGKISYYSYAQIDSLLKSEQEKEIVISNHKKEQKKNLMKSILELNKITERDYFIINKYFEDSIQITKDVFLMKIEDPILDSLERNNI